MTVEFPLADKPTLTGNFVVLRPFTAADIEVIGPVLGLIDGVEDEVFIPFLDQAMAVLELHRTGHLVACWRAGEVL